MFASDHRPGGLTTALALILLLASTPVRGAPGDRSVDVPDVTGMAAREASKLLKSAGLEPKLAGSVPSPANLVGKVAKQNPTGGKKVGAGHKVVLHLGKMAPGGAGGRDRNPRPRARGKSPDRGRITAIRKDPWVDRVVRPDGKRPPIEVAAAKPDLVCVLSAVSFAGEKIGPGQKLLYGGGAPGFTCTVRIKNKGKVAVKQPVRVHVLIKRHGSKVFEKTWQVAPPLAPGASKVAGKSDKVGFSGISNELSVSGRVDPDKEIDESNEGNNNAKLEFSADVVH